MKDLERKTILAIAQVLTENGQGLVELEGEEAWKQSQQRVHVLTESLGILRINYDPSFEEQQLENGHDSKVGRKENLLEVVADVLVPDIVNQLARLSELVGAAIQINQDLRLLEVLLGKQGFH